MVRVSPPWRVSLTSLFGIAPSLAGPTAVRGFGHSLRPTLEVQESRRVCGMQRVALIAKGEQRGAVCSRAHIRLNRAQRLKDLPVSAAKRDLDPIATLLSLNEPGM